MLAQAAAQRPDARGSCFLVFSLTCSPSRVGFPLLMLAKQSQRFLGVKSWYNDDQRKKETPPSPPSPRGRPLPWSISDTHSLLLAAQGLGRGSILACRVALAVEDLGVESVGRVAASRFLTRSLSGLSPVWNLKAADPTFGGS